MIDKSISKLGAKHLQNLRYNRDHNIKMAPKMIFVNNIDTRCLKDNSVDCGSKTDYKEIHKQTIKETLLLNGELASTSNVKVILDERVDFMKKNPQSCTIKEWERIAYGICREVGFKVSVEDMTKTRCDLAFEITREVIPKKCLVPLFIVDKLSKCEPNYIITKRTKEQCETDFNLLLEQVENCDLSFNEYYKLNKKGLNFNALREIYNNALSVRLIGGKVQIIGKINSYVVGEDIEYHNNDLIKSLDNRVEYLKKITEDLNLPEEVLQELYKN